MVELDTSFSWFSKHSKSFVNIKTNDTLLFVNMDSLLRLKTNASLYGPNRISAKTEVKDLLLRDHVLQKGEWDSETWRQNPWISTCSNSFKVRISVLLYLGRYFYILSQPRGFF